MTSDKDDARKIVSDLLLSWSAEELHEIIDSKNESSESQLTIVADPTMHRIPESLMLGDRYNFSMESINTSSNGTVKNSIVNNLTKLAEKLKSKKWSKIRLVFSGHAVLPAHIKMLVYRITHLDTEDVIYFGESGYKTVTINPRTDVIGTNHPISAPK